MADINELKEQLRQAEFNLVEDFKEKYKVGQLFKYEGNAVVLANDLYDENEKVLLQIGVPIRHTDSGYNPTGINLKAFDVTAETVQKLEPIKNIKEALDLESTTPKFRSPVTR